MIVAILQARMSSSRLPGKVLKPVVGKPILALQIERLRRCKTIDKLVLATSNQSSDDALEQLCHTLGIECFRGDLEDVLTRFRDAAKHHMAQHVVRLTGDCPLTDPTLIDQLINHHLLGGFDYTSNIYPRSYPDGLDAEVFTFDTLERMYNEAQQPHEREHVTSYIESHFDDFQIGNLAQDIDQSALRWTLDTQDDFEFIQWVYESLYETNPNFASKDILELTQ